MNEIVRFIGRSAEPHAIKIGNELENLAQSIKFELPHDFKYASVFLHIQFGYYADVVNLGDDRIFKPTRTHTQKPGRYTAYLEVLIDGDVVWKSDVFYLHVGSLPNDGELIEKKYPTAFEEVMKTVASLTDISVEAETLPSGSNATVRLERDENGKAVLVYGLPQGEQGVSPTVDVKPINNGHRITVTDAEGVKTFDVSYGEVSQILTDRVVTLEQSMAEVKKITDNFELFVPKFANTAEGVTLALTDSTDGALQGMKVYGKTTQSGTPTPDAPVPLVSVGDDGAVNVTVAGANLITFPYVSVSKTASGLTYTVNEDGSVSIKGTATEASQFVFADAGTTFADLGITGAATLSCVTRGTLGFVFSDGTSINVEPSTPRATITPNGKTFRIRWLSRAGVTYDETLYPMLNLGTTPLPWEPYKPAQTLTLSTPNDLPSVGDVCDEIDLERGVYVQRVKKTRLTSTMGTGWYAAMNGKRIYTEIKTLRKEIGSPILCTHAVKGEWASDAKGTICLGNGNVGAVGFSTADFATVDEVKAFLDANAVYIVAPLITPIETPLSAEEIEAYKALTTHYPTTTIYNEESARMAIKYAADTKNYIDQKLATLAAAMVNNL